MPLGEFEPIISAGERPQTHALDRAAMELVEERKGAEKRKRKQGGITTDKCMLLDFILLPVRSVYL